MFFEKLMKNLSVYLHLLFILEISEKNTIIPEPV